MLPDVVNDQRGEHPLRIFVVQVHFEDDEAATTQISTDPPAGESLGSLDPHVLEPDPVLLGTREGQLEVFLHLRKGVLDVKARNLAVVSSGQV